MIQPVKRRDQVVYVSLAGHCHAAVVVWVREDGTVDLAVDAGAKHPVQLSRIEVAAQATPGKCWRGDGAQEV